MNLDILNSLHWTLRNRLIQWDEKDFATNKRKVQSFMILYPFSFFSVFYFILSKSTVLYGSAILHILRESIRWYNILSYTMLVFGGGNGVPLHLFLFLFQLLFITLLSVRGGSRKSCHSFCWAQKALWPWRTQWQEGMNSSALIFTSYRSSRPDNQMTATTKTACCIFLFLKRGKKTKNWEHYFVRCWHEKKNPIFVIAMSVDHPLLP